MKSADSSTSSFDLFAYSPETYVVVGLDFYIGALCEEPAGGRGNLASKFFAGAKQQAAFLEEARSDYTATFGDPELVIAQRNAMMAARIRAYAPDILITQECAPDQFVVAAEAMGIDIDESAKKAFAKKNSVGALKIPTDKDMPAQKNTGENPAKESGIFPPNTKNVILFPSVAVAFKNTAGQAVGNAVFVNPRKFRVTDATDITDNVPIGVLAKVEKVPSALVSYKSLNVVSGHLKSGLLEEHMKQRADEWHRIFEVAGAFGDKNAQLLIGADTNADMARGLRLEAEAKKLKGEKNSGKQLTAEESAKIRDYEEAVNWTQNIFGGGTTTSTSAGDRRRVFDLLPVVEKPPDTGLVFVAANQMRGWFSEQIKAYNTWTMRSTDNLVLERFDLSKSHYTMDKNLANSKDDLNFCPAELVDKLNDLASGETVLRAVKDPKYKIASDHLMPNEKEQSDHGPIVVRGFCLWDSSSVDVGFLGYYRWDVYYVFAE